MIERSTIMWRRLDKPGAEVADLTRNGAGWILAGMAVVAHDGRPCALEYRIECDAAWQTETVRIGGHVGGKPAALELVRSPGHSWRMNGTLMPLLQGCVDVDFGFSPVTNLLPIRRLELALGSRAEVRAAWVRFPELTVEVLEQAYTRMGSATYLYESAAGAFRRDLSVNAAGFVVEYPDYWHAEAMTTSPEHAA
jgi:hypothetical protein